MQLLDLWTSKFALFMVGSCVGSFLNVCIHRLPKDLSVIIPGSHCPSCKAGIAWYDNIPLLSFLILRGRCRSCLTRISLRYPLVEALSGLLFVVLYAQLGLSLEFAKFIFLFSLLLVLSSIDVDYHAIPSYLCVLGIIVGLAFAVSATIAQIKAGIFNINALLIVKALKALMFGLGFTYLFKLFGDVFISIYLSIRKKTSIEGEKESLGLGDVDFMGMIAVFLGMKHVVLIFFLAPFIAALYSIFAIIFKRSHLIPYLPYLSLATLVSFFWSNQILRFVFQGSIF